MATEDGRALQEELATTDDLEIARLLEQEIILSHGLRGLCGCVKFAMCPFPRTNWYYTTICQHDNDSAPRALTPTLERTHWWFDVSKMRMISAIDFERTYARALELELPPTEAERLISGDPALIARFVSVRLGERFLYIARGGQVRQIYPKQIPKGGGWL